MSGLALSPASLELVWPYVAALGGYVAGLQRRRAPRARLLLAPLLALPLALAGLLATLPLAALLHAAAIGAALRGAAVLGAIAALAAAAGRWWPRQPPLAVYRGAVIEPAAARGRRACSSPGELVLAGVAVPPADETKHFKILGTTGTGKSTAIATLLGAALARGDRAVIADPDGGYLSRYYDAARGDVILNPFDPRSGRWDPYRELRNAYDAEDLARSLIGEGTGAEAAWRGYAQALLAALLRQTADLEGDRLQLLYRLLSSAPLAELRVLLEGTSAAPLVEEGNERMFGSVRAIAMARTRALEFIQLQQAPAFSVRDWIEHGRGALFLPYRADQIAALRQVIATWLRVAIFQTLSQAEGDHRLWFAVDELDALGAIDGLTDALARLRKFGGRCVLGFQSIAQVAATVGERAAHTIVENCGNTLILRCSASDGGGTARFAAQLIGEREVSRQQLSRSRPAGPFGGRETVSRTEQRVLEPAVLAAEIEALADLTGYLKLASSPRWQQVTLRRP